MVSVVVCLKDRFIDWMRSEVEISLCNGSGGNLQPWRTVSKISVTFY